MRRFLILSSTLLAAGCATAPRQARPAGPQIAPHVPSAIIGLTAAELVQRLGTPALQIREGAGIKLQFRNAQCVLDAYLYQSGSAPHRVTHVDTRTRALARTDQALCIRSFGAP